MSLDKVAIRHAPLSNRIVLARFGKDQTVALETRDATDEFLQMLVSFICEGKMPDPCTLHEMHFGGGDEQFTLTLGRKPLVEMIGE